LAARLEGIDAQTEEQLNSTFYDIGSWLEDSFSADQVSLAAKVERHSSQSSKMYAGAFVAAVAMISVFIYANRKKEEKSHKLEQMRDSFIASAN